MLLVALNGPFSLLVIKVPDSDGEAKSRRLGHLVRIALVGEEEDDPVEAGLNIRHNAVVHLRKEAQHAAITLRIVVLVQVVNTGYATTCKEKRKNVLQGKSNNFFSFQARTIIIWIINVADVLGVIARVAGNHRLGPPANVVLVKLAIGIGGVALGDDRVEDANEETNVIAQRLIALHPDDLVAANHLGVGARRPVVHHLARPKEALVVEEFYLLEDLFAVLQKVVYHTESVLIHVFEDDLTVGGQIPEDVITVGYHSGEASVVAVATADTATLAIALTIAGGRRLLAAETNRGITDLDAGHGRRHLMLLDRGGGNGGISSAIVHL